MSDRTVDTLPKFHHRPMEDVQQPIFDAHQQTVRYTSTSLGRRPVLKITGLASLGLQGVSKPICIVASAAAITGHDYRAGFVGAFVVSILFDGVTWPHLIGRARNGLFLEGYHA